MQQQINELKTTFHRIVGLKNDNEKKNALLELKTKQLKNIYNDFIKNNDEILCVFSLDSLHYQSKVIDIEYDDMKRLFSSILNRMYCEFFKLYKIIIDYVKTSISDKKVTEMVNMNNKYPVYKDLEPFKVYEFEVVENIHDAVLELLHSLISLYTTKENELKKYQNKNKFGFNIDNFVNTIMFNNTMLREKIQLFINYIIFFHKLQIKYLSRYSKKLELVISQLEADIDFEENTRLFEESPVTTPVAASPKEEKNKISQPHDVTDVVKERNSHEDSNYKMPIYTVDYNSDLSSLDGTTTIDVVDNPTELSNSKRKKYLAKKKRLQQKKLESKKALDETLVEKEKVEDENIELTIEEIPTTQSENNEEVL